MIEPQELLKKTAQEKVKGFCRITYQIPEDEESGASARSFEDALVLANPERFGLSKGGDMAIQAWEIAKDMGKTETALRFAIQETDWIVPRYLREGLAWLAEPPPPPSSPPEIEGENSSSAALKEPAE